MIHLFVVFVVTVHGWVFIFFYLNIEIKIKTNLYKFENVYIVGYIKCTTLFCLTLYYNRERERT